MSGQSTRTDGLLIKLANLHAYALFLGAHAFAAKYWPSDHRIAVKETYFTPSSWAFLTWFVLHGLLAGTMIYQFFASGKRVLIDILGWRLALLNALSAAYIFFLAIEEYSLAFFFALIVSSTVTYVYGLIKGSPSQNIFDELFIHTPFSIYHAWTTVIVILSAFQAFGVDALANRPDLWTKAFVFTGLFFLQSFSFAYAYSALEGDLPACLTMSSSLYAIYDKQTVAQAGAFLHWSAFVFTIISLLWVLRSIIGLGRRAWRIWVNTRVRMSGEDEESAPLLNE